MGNRTYAQSQFTDIRDRVKIQATVAFNGSSAASLLKFNPVSGNYTVAAAAGLSHIVSFARTGTGVYVLTLVDKFVRVIEATVTWKSSAAPAAPIWGITLASDPTNGQAFGTSVAAGTVRTGTPSVKFTFYSAQGTAADPGATEVADINLSLQNSTAG